MTEAVAAQEDIDAANAEFWNTLCGSHAAQMLGVTDDGPESLKRFDDWYLDYYPYLLTHVPVHTFKGKKVLEVGMGYCTLSQKIMESGADFTGLDIAAGPVGMCLHRQRQLGLPGQALHRNFLDNGLPDASFDAVVAIGCYHHTGDVQRCFDETWRILKKGGTAHLMVYNRYPHRRWVQNRAAFLDDLKNELLGRLDTITAETAERAAFDRDLAGEAAPETVLLSAWEIKKRMRKYSQVRVSLEDMDESDDPKWRRDKVLNTWGRWMGLCSYIVARK